MISNAEITAFFAGRYDVFYTKYLLNVRKIGGQEYMAPCPFHDDREPSFNFNAETGVYFCHGCGKKGHVLHFYGKLNGLETKRDFGRILAGIARDFDIPVADTKSRFVAGYDYTDEGGTLLFQVCRYEPKAFKQRVPDDKGGWVYNLNGVRRTLYRLPEVLRASEVIVVEGEKDADAVAALGFTGTTAPMGANKWSPEYSEALRGKDVVLIPDNDNEGREHMLQVGSALNGIARSLKWIDLPGVPSKGDISDWLQRFPSNEAAIESLSGMIVDAPLYKPPKKATHEDAVLEISDYYQIELPPKRSFLHPVIMEQQIGLFSGWRGVGKTWGALGAIDAITRGESFGPWQTVLPVPCLYLDGEMAAQDPRDRLRALNPDMVRKAPLYIYSDSYASLLGLPRAHLLNEAWRGKMKSILLARKVKVWFLDNVASLAGGIDENSKKDWDPINAWLLELRFAGITTVLLHHVGKQGLQRGTSAREDHADWSIILKQPPNYHPEDGADFIWTFTKSRLSCEDLHLIQDTRFTLRPDEPGRLRWEWRYVKAEIREQVLTMIDQRIPQQEIAELLGVSAGRISQIKAKAIKDGIMTKGGSLVE